MTDRFLVQFKDKQLVINDIKSVLKELYKLEGDYDVLLSDVGIQTSIYVERQQSPSFKFYEGVSAELDEPQGLPHLISNTDIEPFSIENYPSIHNFYKRLHTFITTGVRETEVGSLILSKIISEDSLYLPLADCEEEMTTIITCVTTIGEIIHRLTRSVELYYNNFVYWVDLFNKSKSSEDGLTYAIEQDGFSYLFLSEWYNLCTFKYNMPTTLLAYLTDLDVSYDEKLMVFDCFVTEVFSVVQKTFQYSMDNYNK